MKHKLTDLYIKKIPLLEKGRQKISDGGNGLTLVVSVRDKTWYVRSRVNGKEQNVRIGKFPAMTLALARETAAEIRARLASGLPPLPEKKTFADVMDEWLKIQEPKVSEAHFIDIKQRLTKHILPSLGDKLITQIRPIHILEILRHIADAGHRETARRLRQYISSIFNVGIQLEFVETNPAAALQDFLPTPKVKHIPALTKPEEIKALFEACVNYYGSPTVRNALVMCALTASRPGMIIQMEWADIDIQNRTWIIPAHKMKMKRIFRIPLCDNAITVLEAQRKISQGIYVFSGRQPDRHISDNTMRMALKSMGYQHLPHGWRSSFSTIAHESGLWRTEVIEVALSHEDESKVRAAYARTDYFEERKKLMEWWSEFLINDTNKK